MSLPNGSDPLDRLRAADPVRADGVPDASIARVEAMIQEHIMTDFQQTPVRAPRRQIALIGGLAVTGALALAIAFGPGLGSQAPGPIGAAPIGPSPTPSEDPAGGGGGAMASCIMYDPATLPTFDIVFDGTVTAIDGAQVTFEVNEGWKGVDASVALTAPDTNVALIGPIPDFEVGGRYLVTAAGSNINACGYTLVYDAATAATWAAAFGS